MSRYRVEKAAGFTGMLWRVRARLEDSETGESLELRSREAAEDLCAVLEKADAGELERLPADASPFRRYETSALPNGWIYLWHAEGSLNHEAFARTRSPDFARRAVEALNRDRPRKLRNPFGPVKARWF